MKFIALGLPTEIPAQAAPHPKANSDNVLLATLTSPRFGPSKAKWTNFVNKHPVSDYTLDMNDRGCIVLVNFAEEMGGTNSESLPKKTVAFLVWTRFLKPWKGTSR